MPTQVLHGMGKRKTTIEGGKEGADTTGYIVTSNQRPMELVGQGCRNTQLTRPAMYQTQQGVGGNMPKNTHTHFHWPAGLRGRCYSNNTHTFHHEQKNAIKYVKGSSAGSGGST